MTLTAVSSLTGLSVASLLKLVKAGKLKARKVKGEWELAYDRLEEFLGSAGTVVGGGEYTTPGGQKYSLVYTVSRPSLQREGIQATVRVPDSLQITATQEGITKLESRLGFDEGTAITDLVRTDQYQRWRANVKTALDKRDG